MRPASAVHRSGKITFRKVLACGCLSLGVLSLFCCGGVNSWLYFGTNFFVEHEAYSASPDPNRPGNDVPRQILWASPKVHMANNFQKPANPGVADFSRLPTTYYYPTGP